MNQASHHNERAFRALLATSGESVVFRHRPVAAMVDRGLDARAVATGQIAFTELDQSRVEILRCAVGEIPLAGEWFVDGDERHHRIQTVRTTDITYRCDCLVANTEPQTAPL